MSPALVNTDYDFVLFKDLTGEVSNDLVLRARIARQYLFYFINKDPAASLVNFCQLSQATIDYYHRIGVNLPSFVMNEKGENWYGQLSNLSLERQLNSKLETYSFLRNLGELHEDLHIVSRAEEIRKILNGSHLKKWLLKTPFSHAGKGFTLINSFDDIPEKLPFDHILEPYLDRVLDFSLYYDPKTKHEFSYITKILPNGFYLGGLVHENDAALKSELSSLGLLKPYMDTLDQSRSYLQMLKRLPLSQPVTIDGFLYRDGITIRGYPMCEINYRVSMGSLNAALKRFLPDGGSGLLLNLKPNKIIDWKMISPYDPKRKIGIMTLNDGNPLCDVLFLAAPNPGARQRFESLVFHNN